MRVSMLTSHCGLSESMSPSESTNVSGEVMPPLNASRNCVSVVRKAVRPRLVSLSGQNSVISLARDTGTASTAK